MKTINLILIAVILLVCLVVLNACQAVKSPLEDYTWVLTSYGQLGDMKTPLEGTEITVIFNSQEKTFSGNAGCNHYSGTYTLDGANLDIGAQIAVTEMWCGEAIGEQETKYLEALQAAQSYSIDDGNLVINCGQQMLNFKKK